MQGTVYSDAGGVLAIGDGVFRPDAPLEGAYGAARGGAWQGFRNGCKSALGIFAVSTAYAFADCNYFVRSAVVSMAGMVVSGITANPLGFFISGFGVANSMHGYARCMEASRT